MEALGIDHAQNKAPSDFPNDVLDALRASDQWLRTIVDKIDIDPDKTEFAVDAVSSTSRRPLARMTLTERLAANKNVLDTADNAAKRLPTLEEAAHAAAILLRCNGHDLERLRPQSRCTKSRYAECYPNPHRSQSQGINEDA